MFSVHAISGHAAEGLVLLNTLFCKCHICGGPLALGAQLEHAFEGCLCLSIRTPSFFKRFRQTEMPKRVEADV